MKRILYSAICLLLLASCANQYEYSPVETPPYYPTNPEVVYDDVSIDSEYKDTVQTDKFEIYLTYIGMGSNYFIFECNFFNKSEMMLAVDRTDFTMDIDPGRVKRPSDAESITQELRSFKKELKKEKKKRTIWGAVLTGLEFVAAATSGYPVGENLLFTAEPIAYIFEDRSLIQRDIESVEDEIAYIHDMCLEREELKSGESITKDLLFPIQLIGSDVKIIYTRDRAEHITLFKEAIFRNR